MALYAISDFHLAFKIDKANGHIWRKVAKS